jgi:spore coat polysaccharide biosynthesis protein SpsF
MEEMTEKRLEMENKIVAIIQARMTSSRLPGKVMLDIAGYPMLDHVLYRVSKTKLVDEIIVATTTNPADDPIEVFCHEKGFSCFRGSEFDVLDRFYQSALANEADIIVRITADCPLIDADMIDAMLKSFMDNQVDFAANRLPPPWKRTFPIGLDIEIASFQALENAWKNATTKFEREHVMPYLYEVPERFKTLLIHHEPDYGNRRWTVDTAEDLVLVRRIFQHFSPQRDFGWLEVVELLALNPGWETVNFNVPAKQVDEVDERFQSQGEK